MATRHTSRTWALQALFAMDFNPTSPDQALAHLLRDKNPDEKSRRFATELTQGVRANIEQLDAIISRHASNWNLCRINAVDRNIMRMALFEILHQPDTPPIVAINEAVELAKRFGSDESGKFVNGILDQARLATARGTPND